MSWYSLCLCLSVSVCVLIVQLSVFADDMDIPQPNPKAGEVCWIVVVFRCRYISMELSSNCENNSFGRVVFVVAMRSSCP